MWCLFCTHLLRTSLHEKIQECSKAYKKRSDSNCLEKRRIFKASQQFCFHIDKQMGRWGSRNWRIFADALYLTVKQCNSVPFKVQFHLLWWVFIKFHNIPLESGIISENLEYLASLNYCKWMRKERKILLKFGISVIITKIFENRMWKY